jgi:hypothetical protein
MGATLRRTLLLLAGVIVALLAWWGSAKVVGGDEAPTASRGAPQRTSDELVELSRDMQARRGTVPWTPPRRLDGGVTIAGTVVDADSGDGVGGVEVVFRNEAGEEATTTAGANGAYWIDLPIGTYRAFVRGATVVSVEQPSNGGLLGPDVASFPDEALMPVVVADVDLDGVDLTVTRGGVLRGKVVDTAGRAIATAVLRARTAGGGSPALATELVESKADGTFELRLPAGTYGLEASHPQFVGIAADRAELTLLPGEVQTKTFILVAGCVIAGRVVRADGMPSGDGALERRSESTGFEFARTGGIAADGTFRWTTTEQAEVVLRAWPWKSQPSEAQSFECSEGARYEQVVFMLPDRGPDLEGELVDHTGAPVANAYIDVLGLSPSRDQRERTDAQGRWSLFALRPGPYRINGHAPGRGIASVKVTAPGGWIRIQLEGTGRIEGIAEAVADGSFELELAACAGGSSYVPLSTERRLVTVTNGRFTVEDVPACHLQVIASWRGHHTRGEVTVPSGGTGRLELALPGGPDQLCLAEAHE